jgi:hypothetical protein
MFHVRHLLFSSSALVGTDFFLLPMLQYFLTVRNKLILKPHEWHKQITSFSVKVTEDRPRFDLTDAFLDKTGEFWLI